MTTITFQELEDIFKSNPELKPTDWTSDRTAHQLLQLLINSPNYYKILQLAKLAVKNRPSNPILDKINSNHLQIQQLIKQQQLLYRKLEIDHPPKRQKL